MTCILLLVMLWFIAIAVTSGLLVRCTEEPPFGRRSTECSYVLHGGCVQLDFMGLDV